MAFVCRTEADPVDELMREALRHHPIPGAALAVIKDGRIVKTNAYGLANLEWQTPVTLDTSFEIGSVTKQFTAAAILVLAQEGRLSVDDVISRHLPGTPATWRQITLRHLLTHTSGLKNYTGLPGFELTRHLTQSQFVAQIAAHALEFPPGARWSYCNTGYNLLGYVVENVSGTNYVAFLQQRLFTPLQMTATTSRDPGAVIPHRANGYETNATGQFINRDFDLTDIFSAGEIVSTVGDLAKWNVALDTGKILTPASREEMWTPVRLNDGSSHPYGFGWFLEPYQGHPNVGHSGATDGFSASLQRFPEANLTVIVLCNSDEFDIATKLARQIAVLEMKDGR
jgi:CubicO group peptidase (beta-lactamase class C family)